MFAYRIDDLELRLLEERHAQQLFEAIERDREDLRTWLPWVDGTRSTELAERRWAGLTVAPPG